MKFTPALLAIGLLSLSSYSNSIAKPTAPTQPIQIHTPDPSTLNSSVGIIGISPRALDFFIYDNSIVYPEEGLGYSMRYKAPANTWADVYVYPVPEDLENHPHEDIVGIMTGSTIGDIEKAEEMGLYQDFEIFNPKLIKLDGGIQAQVYGRFLVNGRQAVTAIYLTEKEGKIFKIRITQLDNTYDASVASLWDNFANRMFDFLIKHHEEA